MKKIKSHPLIIPIAEVLAKAISFINILLLIRIFSIDEYADYSYLISIILWASVLMDSGINDLIYNKSLKNDSNDLNELFTGKVVLSVIVVFLLSIFLFLKKPLLIIPGFILSWVIVFTSLTALIKMYSRGNHYTENDLVTIFTEPLIRLVFLVVVYFTMSTFSWSFEHVLLLFLLAGILAYTYSYFQLIKKYHFQLLLAHFKEPAMKIKKILNKTRFFLLYYLMLIGLQRLDIIMLDKYGTKTDLALFSTSITIYQVIYLFFYALITAKILFLINNKKYLTRYILPGLLLIVLATFIISPFLYQFLFPQVYFNGHKVLNYLMISIIPAVFSLYFIIKNNFKGKMKLNFYFLAVVFMFKFITYQVLKPNDLSVYYTIYGIMEFLLVLLFILYQNRNESSTNK